MTEYLVTIQLKTSYTVSVLAEDKEQAITTALEQDPPAKLTYDNQRTVQKVLRLIQTDRGLRYVEEKARAQP